MKDANGMTFKRRTHLLLSSVGVMISFILIISTIGLYYVADKYNGTVNRQFNIRGHLKNAKIYMIQASRAEKDFLMRMDDKYLEVHKKSIEQAKGEIEALSPYYSQNRFEEEFAPLFENTASYASKFNTLVSEVKKGSGTSGGIDKELSSKILQINSYLKNIEDHIYANLLKKEFAVQLFKLNRDSLNFIHTQSSADLDATLAQSALLSTRFEELGAPDESKTYMREQLNNFESVLKNISFKAENTIQGNPGISKADIHNFEKRVDDIIIKVQEDFSAQIDNLDLQKKLILGLLAIIGLSSLAGLMYAARFYFNIADFIYDMVGKIDDNIAGDTEGVEKLNTAADLVASSVDDQASAVEQTMSTLTELTEIVSNNLEGAKNSLEMTKSSHSNVMNSKKSIQSVVSSIKEIDANNKDIVEQVTKSNQDMEEIVNVIQNISDKTSVINDIVFQTKLLSFNASVEAARAGEHGKGFAVVAEEVGNLAQMSGNAAKEIEDMLSGSVEKVRDIVNSTSNSISGLVEKGTEKTNQGIDLATNCEGLLEDVVKHSQSIKQSMDDIVVAGQEQEKGIRQISTAMTQLDSSINDILFTAKNTSHFASRIEESSRLNLNYLHDLRNMLRGKDVPEKKLAKVIPLPKDDPKRQEVQTKIKKVVGESFPSSDDDRFN